MGLTFTQCRKSLSDSEITQRSFRDHWSQKKDEGKKAGKGWASEPSVGAVVDLGPDGLGLGDA